MSNLDFFRPKSGYFMGGIVFLISAGMVVATAFDATAFETLISFAWAITVSEIAYLIFIRPSVALFDEGIIITNPFMKISAGWDQIEEIEARWCMSIILEGKHFYAWAAPAPGRYHGRTIHSSEVRGLGLKNDSLIRPGESPRTHSGAAAALARIRMETFRSQVRDNGIKSTVVFNTSGLLTLIFTLMSSVALTFMHF